MEDGVRRRVWLRGPVRRLEEKPTRLPKQCRLSVGFVNKRARKLERPRESSSRELHFARTFTELQRTSRRPNIQAKELSEGELSVLFCPGCAAAFTLRLVLTAARKKKLTPFTCGEVYIRRGHQVQSRKREKQRLNRQNRQNSSIKAFDQTVLLTLMSTLLGTPVHPNITALL